MVSSASWQDYFIDFYRLQHYVKGIVRLFLYYRPHLKDGEWNVFSLFVSPQRGVPNLGQPGGGDAPSRVGGVPHLGQDGGNPSAMCGYPLGQDGGTPRHDGVTSPQPGWGTPLPARMRVPPPPPGMGRLVQVCYVAGGTPLPVSRRRIFLCYLIFT